MVSVYTLCSTWPAISMVQGMLMGHQVIQYMIRQSSKLWSVMTYDQPDFQFDQTIFSWNLQKWPITEWDYVDSEVWQTACVWHGRWNEKKKVC